MYKRGQDSAELLMFEQCTHNIIAYNDERFHPHENRVSPTSGIARRQAHRGRADPLDGLISE